MPFVMVPVPAEHEEELIQAILKMTVRQSMASWDPADLAQMVAEAEPSWRALLQFLVDCYPDTPHPSGPEIAQHLDVDEMELVALGHQINRWCKTNGWPVLLLVHPVETPTVDGRLETMYVAPAIVGQLRAALDGFADGSTPG